MGVGDGAAAVHIPIAILTQDEVVGEAPDGYRLVAAIIADLGSHVLPREEIRRVHVLIAGQAELRRVGSAKQNRRPLAAEIARNSLGATTHDLLFKNPLSKIPI